MFRFAGTEFRLPEIRCQLRHLLMVSCLTAFLTSLCLGYHICKIGVLQSSAYRIIIRIGQVELIHAQVILNKCQLKLLRISRLEQWGQKHQQGRSPSQCVHLILFPSIHAFFYKYVSFRAFLSRYISIVSFKSVEKVFWNSFDY